MKSLFLFLCVFSISFGSIANDFNSTKKRAEQGDADAQFNLGVIYYRGKGVPQNYQEAAKWLRKAAEQGDARSQYNLGVMFYKGEGVLESSIMAYMWLNLAEYNGNILAERGARVMRSSMSSQDLIKSQKMFVRCLESFYKDCN
ncbi:hypothetical protein VoSk93_08230 [Vibrio owensii]